MEDNKVSPPVEAPENQNELPDDANHDAVQPPKPKSKKKWLWLGLVAVLVAAAAAYWFFVRDDEPQISINSYDECVAAGYPVMESYPEQCAVPDGQTFTRQLSEEERDDNNSALIESDSDLITDLGDNPIRLYEAGDENELPNITPKSFVSYIKQVLAGNQPDETNCIEAYQVTRISLVNIEGAIGTVDAVSRDQESTGSCFGAAKMTWYLQDGAWHDKGYQGLILCEELNQTTIYAEFIPSCYEGEETDAILPNPNGSIDDAEL